MYAARPKILEDTGRDKLGSDYFTQKVLPQYMADYRYREKTATWDVVYDARGHFEEPHTRVTVAIGTLNVRAYLKDLAEHRVEEVKAADFIQTRLFPTCRPTQRFSAVLFIEKEGFLPLFKAVKLAERFDIAIMSTEGMPVVAVRHLADELCGPHGIPLLLLHDFDKSGFSMVGTLQNVDRYDPATLADLPKRCEYRHEFEVIDLGLRLADAKEDNLQSEPVAYKGGPRDNFEQNGATAEEISFLCGSYGCFGSKLRWRGNRVELNAFTAEGLVLWIEGKLKKHGIGKMVPDDDTLAAAYRRAAHIILVEEQLPEIIQAAGQKAAEVEIPRELGRRVLKTDPTIPWDEAVRLLAEPKCKKRRLVKGPSKLNGEQRR
jgi:hypothetical protein